MIQYIIVVYTAVYIALLNLHSTAESQTLAQLHARNLKHRESRDRRTLCLCFCLAFALPSFFSAQFGPFLPGKRTVFDSIPLFYSIILFYSSTAGILALVRLHLPPHRNNRKEQGTLTLSASNKIYGQRKKSDVEEICVRHPDASRRDHTAHHSSRLVTGDQASEQRDTTHIT